MGRIRTVLGDIPPHKFGLALAHEHILVDFIGADKHAKERYDPNEVFTVMLPYLKEIRKLGVTGFVECTPNYMARDARLLARLSEAADIHILTNTGLYKEPYLPKYAFRSSADQLADQWTSEITEEIEDTNVKAGFIKIAVNPGRIAPIQEKIVKAAARCSLSTGAAIACHTASGVAALHLLEILEEEGTDPERLIVVHSDAEEDTEYHLKIASSGAWVEYDAVREETAERTLTLLRLMQEHGLEDQVLLSQDAGWYNVGEQGGGEIRGFRYLVRDFVPLMLENGFSKELADKILIRNPSKAFQIQL